MTNKSPLSFDDWSRLMDEVSAKCDLAQSKYEAADKACQQLFDIYEAMMDQLEVVSGQYNDWNLYNNLSSDQIRQVSKRMSILMENSQLVHDMYIKASKQSDKAYEVYEKLQKLDMRVSEEYLQWLKANPARRSGH